MFEEETENSEVADADFPSGPWTGFYLQFGRRYAQDLVLSFAKGVLSGSGHDSLGGFTIRGRYDVASKEVTWHKRYAGQYDVYYRGFREIKGIWGTWELGSFDRGGFHIWPEGEGNLSLAREEAKESDAPLVVGPNPKIL